MADAAAGDVVVGCSDEKNGFGAAYAVGHEFDVMNAAFEDVDLLVVEDLREKAVQLGFVAAVGVNLVLS